MDFQINTVQRNTLSQQVMEQFIEMLMNGMLSPGDKLPSEKELMTQFDVSRPVLREALSSLETLEIITRKPRGGTYINNSVGNAPFKAMLSLFINNVPAVIEARMTLELGLVTLAAEKISDNHLRQLEKSINDIYKNKDYNYGMLDKKFHQIIAQSAGNPVIKGMIDSLLVVHNKTDSLIPFREPQKTVDQHIAIYEGLKNKDPIESFKRMYEHLNFVRNKILLNYKK